VVLILLFWNCSIALNRLIDITPANIGRPRSGDKRGQEGNLSNFWGFFKVWRSTATYFLHALRTVAPRIYTVGDPLQTGVKWWCKGSRPARQEDPNMAPSVKTTISGDIRGCPNFLLTYLFRCCLAARPIKSDRLRIRYNTILKYLTCSQKTARCQLCIPHGIRNWK